MRKKIFIILAIGFLFSPGRFGFCLQFDSAPLMKEAKVYLQQGRFLESVQTYHQVFRYSREENVRARALVRMADVLALFVDKKEQALEYYEKAIEKFPGEKELRNAYFNSAMLYYELGKLEDADKRFGKYLQLFPEAKRVLTAQYMRDRIKQEKGRKKEKKEKKEFAREKESEPKIRVDLGGNFPVRISLDQGGTLSSLPDSDYLEPGVYTVNFKNKEFFIQGKKIGPQAKIEITGKFGIKDKKYPGDLVFTRSGDKPKLVNELGIEKYLQGVVPQEMSPSWRLQALKAQAVAARSYAYYLLLHSEDKAYDVSSTTASQVYGGVNAGNADTKKAVRSTSGEILMHNKEPVLSYFHAHSGGMLEDAGLVWTTSLPYYKVLEDQISSQYKSMQWETEISTAELVNCLQEHGFKLGSIQDVVPEEHSPSGRVSRIRIDTDKGPLEVKSNSLRLWLGAGKIKSTFYDITKKNGNYVFSGRGFGHGVGLSQWGAQGMAVQGKDYRRILKHYYPNTKLRRIW